MDNASLARAKIGTSLGFLFVIGVCGLVLIPSLWLLFSVFKARNPQGQACRPENR